MHWNPFSRLAPIPGRFASVRVLQPDNPRRAQAERYIARVYRQRYGAELKTFLPHLLEFHDGDGRRVAAVGLRLASEGPLFAEQYLQAPAEQVVSARGIGPVSRDAIAEAGNFAADTPGSARELIQQLTWMLHAARTEWVLFVATRQLRNAFDRLHLSPFELAEAHPECLAGDGSDWGDYYASQPRVMCGNVTAGHAFLQRQGSTPAPCLCLAAAS